MSFLGEMLPNYSQLKPTTINWASDFHWSDEAGLQLGHALLRDGIAAQKLDQSDFFERSRILRDDLSALAAAAEDEETLVIIDSIKLAVSQPFTHGLRNVGELAQAYDWILWSISRNFAVHSLPARKITRDGENTSDMPRTLNPRFVEALMGWPIAWTDFGSVATAWCLWLQRMRFEFCRLGSISMDDVQSTIL